VRRRAVSACSLRLRVRHVPLLSRVPSAEGLRWRGTETRPTRGRRCSTLRRPDRSPRRWGISTRRCGSPRSGAPSGAAPRRLVPGPRRYWSKPPSRRAPVHASMSASSSACSVSINALRPSTSTSTSVSVSPRSANHWRNLGRLVLLSDSQRSNTSGVAGPCAPRYAAMTVGAAFRARGARIEVLPSHPPGEDLPPADLHASSSSRTVPVTREAHRARRLRRCRSLPMEHQRQAAGAGQVDDTQGRLSTPRRPWTPGPAEDRPSSH
jgi:hypothetical protein